MVLKNIVITIEYCFSIVKVYNFTNISWLFTCFKVRPCKRWNIPTFILLQNLKHGIFQIFRIYQKYCVKIVSKMLQNACSDSNFNPIYDYHYGMQGLTLRHMSKVPFNSSENLANRNINKFCL